MPCERTEAKLTLTAPTVTLNPKNGVWLRAEVRDANSPHQDIADVPLWPWSSYQLPKCVCLSLLYIKFTVYSSTVFFYLYASTFFFFFFLHLIVCVCSLSNRLCYQQISFVTKTTMMTHRWSASYPRRWSRTQEMSKSYQSNSCWLHDLLLCSIHRFKRGRKLLTWPYVSVKNAFIHLS